MKIPFLNLFWRRKSIETALTVTPPPVVLIEKPASERFGKTVMPNVSRIVGLDSGQNSGLSAAATTNLVTQGSAAGVIKAPRNISLGADGSLSPASKVANDETAIAIAERKISLELADLLPQIPPELVRSQSVDPEHRVLLRAVDVERGMASGKPTLSLRSLYQQAPEFFTREVNETDPTCLALPFAKVLEQFANFHVRSDQVRDEHIPEMETPFLQVTLEDRERLGTPPLPSPIRDPGPPAAIKESPFLRQPTARLEKESPANAEAKAIHTPAGPPELKPVASIRLPVVPKENKPSISSPALPHPEASPPSWLSAQAPQPVAKISPNGIGVPASERVPASSGPPVPTSTSFASAVPSVRMPFRIPPPSDDLRAPARLDQPSWGPKLSGANIPSGGELRVKLPLRKVLSGILPFQLSGPEAHEVPDAAEVEFPFSIIQPQLSFGRIQVSPAQFQAGLSEELRTRFTINDPDTPIALPLPDVLQSLPNDCLRLRGDQDEIESVEQFETPFSQKAAEDAARIKQGIAPIVGRAPTDLSRTEPVRTELVAEPAKRIAVKVRIPPSLTTTAATESAFVSSRLPCEANEPEALDAKAAVAQASSLPGVQACGIVFSDGLSLAENLPSACEMDGLCAIAPAFMKKIGEQVGGARVGPLTGVTLFCGQAGITFFAHGNICLAALHSACEALTAEVRARLDRVAKELAQTYAESA